MVGRMVRGYPSIVRRIYNEGHTVANHSQNHPFTFAKMSVDQASVEIEDGFASLRTALGDPKAVAPFFRIPGLLRQNSVEQYLAAHDVMTWSVDVVADDWTHINAAEVAHRAVSRLEARGKGILLLHDIQPATALAFPEILKELKAKGFKIVHVVPATADRPKTVTSADQWIARSTPEQKVWPRLVSVDSTADLSADEPVLPVPSARSLGLSDSASAGEDDRAGAELRAADAARGRSPAAAGPAVAAPDLRGAGRRRTPARSRRADLPVHPHLRDARDGHDRRREEKEEGARRNANREAEGSERACHHHFDCGSRTSPSGQPQADGRAAAGVADPEFHAIAPSGRPAANAAA